MYIIAYSVFNCIISNQIDLYYNTFNKHASLYKQLQKSHAKLKSAREGKKKSNGIVVVLSPISNFYILEYIQIYSRTPSRTIKLRGKQMLLIIFKLHILGLRR